MKSALSQPYEINTADDILLHDGNGSSSMQPRCYDLEERTARFGEAVIHFASGLPRSPVLDPLVNQLGRAGTSPGANYCEADDAVSKKEFYLKIGTCKKEARETKHWLRMIVAAHPASREKARSLWQEAKELHLIFAAIIRTKHRTLNDK